MRISNPHKVTGKYRVRISILLVSLIQMIVFLSACTGIGGIMDNKTRGIRDLSENTWRLWLDSAALWKEDPLFLPPVELTRIPVNSPGCGWQDLYSNGLEIRIPATVEQYYWDPAKDSSGAEGDYSGVSWFTTQSFIPREFRGKIIMMEFESVRLRAEIFINNKLAAYDIIGNTPFSANITEFANPGENNNIAVRITDPGGNFDWGDYHIDRWGELYIPPSHGFGGITGKIRIYAVDSVSLGNIYIMNKPDITSVDIQTVITNRTGKSIRGVIDFRIYKKNSTKCLLKKEIQVTALRGDNSFLIPVQLTNAIPWSPDQPELYRLETRWNSEDGSRDMLKEFFGFRWFEIKNIEGDRQLFLNGSRVFLLSSISWGFWPSNGIFPEYGMEIKQIETAKQLGLNMMNFHRAIGDPRSLEAADKLGLLIYEEPGGYRCPSENILFWDPGCDSVKISWKDIELARQWRRIKLFRMIQRDRNHPSLIMYNLQNEILHDPDSQNIADIMEAHKLDPGRLITYSSNSFQEPFMKGNYGGKCPVIEAPAKLYMEPNNNNLLYQGWWDQHFAHGPGTYIDSVHYKNPSEYFHGTNHPDEIIFYGEEGSIGGPSRLSLIKKDLDSGKYTRGWDGDYYLDAFAGFDSFLKKHGFHAPDNDMDDYLKSFGNVAYYYQGRIIENCLINNVIDGYVINGWENSRFSNFSGMVDIYRNPKGDPEVLARYTKGSYIAVKVRNKVIPSGTNTFADIFLVNQSELEGEFRLKIKQEYGGQIVNLCDTSINLGKKKQIGQLLLDGVKIFSPSDTFHGYINVIASIENNRRQIISGRDEVFMIHCSYNGIHQGEFIENNTAYKEFFLRECGLKENKDTKPTGKYMVLGSYSNSGKLHGLEEWLSDGNKLIILTDTHLWLKLLAGMGLVAPGIMYPLEIDWYGGHFFAMEHKLFNDLPVNQGFNWEYQVLARYTANRYCIDIEGAKAVAGAFSREYSNPGIAVGIIPVGKGEIVFSTLDIMPNLVSEERAAIMAKKILQNYLEYASE